MCDKSGEAVSIVRRVLLCWRWKAVVKSYGFQVELEPNQIKTTWTTKRASKGKTWTYAWCRLSLKRNSLTSVTMVAHNFVSWDMRTIVPHLSSQCCLACRQCSYQNLVAVASKKIPTPFQTAPHGFNKWSSRARNLGTMCWRRRLWTTPCKSTRRYLKSSLSTKLQTPRRLFRVSRTKMFAWKLDVRRAGSNLCSCFSPHRTKTG